MTVAAQLNADDGDESPEEVADISQGAIAKAKQETSSSEWVDAMKEYGASMTASHFRDDPHSW